MTLLCRKLKTKLFDIVLLEFEKNLSPFIRWCKFNRLDINWTKTDFMFVCSKNKFTVPYSMEINGGGER